MSEPAGFVVDAGVAIKLVMPETDSDVARALFASALATPGQLHAPELLYAECANALWKYHLRLGADASVVTEAMAVIGALAITVWPLRGLASTALERALALGVSAYDACYVALAESTGATLISADARLCSALVSWSGPWLALRDWRP